MLKVTFSFLRYLQQLQQTNKTNTILFEKRDLSQYVRLLLFIFVVTCCYSLSLVVSLVVIGCHLLSLVVARCISYTVTLTKTLYNYSKQTNLSVQRQSPVGFLSKSCRPQDCNFIKGETPTNMFFCVFCKIFKNITFYRAAVWLFLTGVTQKINFSNHVLPIKLRR